MQMSEPTPQMREEWKATFKQYKDKLRPNKKTAHQIMEYLKGKYQLIDCTNDMTTDGTGKMAEIVIDNIIMNEYFAKKIPIGATLQPQVFIIKNTGAGKTLYDKQDEIFKGIRIIVGVEFETAFYMVEGSSYLYDELRAFKGLDAQDLTNPFLVWEYIDCLKKFGLLDRVL